MKNLTFTILCLSIILYSSIRPREVKIEEKIKEVERYEDSSVQKLNDLYKYLINPLRKKFGEIYITSIWRDDLGQHGLWEAFDWDQDVLIRRGCDTCATNAEVYAFIRDSLPYYQLIIYGFISKPAFGHVGFKKGRNKKENLLGRYYWKNGRKKVWYKKLK